MGEVLEKRRQSSSVRLDDLASRLEKAKSYVKGNACVYVSGSFARGEASAHSDLDLFIVGEADGDRRKLRNLDEICLKAELIHKTRAMGLPPFSGDGRWLIHYTVEELLKTLGRADDDASNTFTARLLLLLESRVILGEEVYKDCIGNVISAYWRDYEDHKDGFMPAFLANDILRLWRTFCVNYEARTQTDPAELKAKRKLVNYKLKHSRLLTCYSALAYMLAAFERNKTVHPEDAIEMVGLSPTERLERVSEWPEAAAAKEPIRSALSKYERFLEVTARPPEDLITEFLNPSVARDRAREAKELGGAMFDVLSALGQNSEFFRLLVV